MATFFTPAPALRRLFAGLAALLTTGFTTLALATKPTPAPPPSAFDHPAVHFVEPKPGAKLTGVTPVKLALGAVDQIAKLELGVGSRLFTLPYLGGNLFVPTREFPNGATAVVARATYMSGQVIEARVRVEVYNPNHRLELINPITRTPTRGALAIVELTYNEPVRIEADFRELDSAFDAGKVKVADVGAGVYRVSYPISSGNTQPEGRRRVVFRAHNARGEVVEDAFELELRRNPLLPIVLSRCLYTQKVLGAMLVDRVGEPDPDVEISRAAPDAQAHGLEIKALPDLVLGRVNHARLLWKAPRQRDAKRPAEPHLVIKARGYSGYYLCWIPEGVTSGHLELAMPGPGEYGSNLAAGDRVPSEVELMVAIETRGLATAWVSHRFTIRPLGWQRPLTASEQAVRGQKIKKRKAAREQTSP